MENNFMTFNLKYDFSSGDENDWGKRVKRICKIIKDNDPLCIGIQEGLIHMLKDMSMYLEDYLWFGEGRNGGDLGEFNAIFYKKDILNFKDSGQFWLSETPNIKGSKSFNSACERICTWGTFEEKTSGKVFTIYNTHLDHESDLARREGVKIILNFAKKKFKKENNPFMIMGDFNCYLDDEVFNIIKSYNNLDFCVRNIYDEVNHNIKSTFHDFKGGDDGEIIDYILISKGIICNDIKIDNRIIDSGYPSDHYPVISRLIIN
ncbi:endonuclease/exonuclease/phosphatase family protein [Clostridium baratii]|uniref:endonuclease/exonuclease/phosphatase family protein n=1 Tax=Clostridium baratii TaxID=1561 RepID=UPI003D358111